MQTRTTTGVVVKTSLGYVRIREESLAFGNTGERISYTESIYSATVFSSFDKFLKTKYLNFHDAVIKTHAMAVPVEVIENREVIVQT